LTGRCCYATWNLSTTYAQDHEHLAEQLVGHLWITGGLLQGISHRELSPALYAINHGSRPLILAKFVMRDE
jgi:hypothetical protein